MADRNTVQKGYSYRDSSTDVQADLEKPEQTFQSGGVSARQTQDLRRPDRTPVVDALLAIAGNELKELKKAGDIQQGTEGAIRAGQEEGMASIRKRGSAMDWVFGTRAKTAEAAAVHSSVKITEWSASSLQDMPNMQEVDPDDYAELKRREIADAADAIDDPELKAAFLQQGNQRLAKLVAIQMEQNHEYVQNKASNDYQVDLKARLAHLQEMEAIGGLAYEIAKEELYTLFDIRPDGMTVEAHQAAIAQAIISEAYEGRRELYEYADAQGMFDNMPEEMRTELEEAYKKIAPINDPKFISATENYIKEMLDPTISETEFARRQLKFIADWDTVHSYSDPELANHRVRHSKAKAATKQSAFDEAAATDAYARKDRNYLAGLTGTQQQKAAVSWIHSLHRQNLTASKQAEYDGLTTPQKNKVMFDSILGGFASEDPKDTAQSMATLTSIAQHTSEVGYNVKMLENLFEMSTSSLIDHNGQPHLHAQQSLLMMSQFIQTGNKHYLSNLVNEDTAATILMFDRLTNGHNMDGNEAMHTMSDLKNSEPRRISADDKASYRDNALEAFNDNLQGTGRGTGFLGYFNTPDIVNEDEVFAEILAHAKILMNTSNAYDGESALEAAGLVVANQREALGPHAIPKGSNASLSNLMGFSQDRPDLEDDLTRAFTTKNPNIPVKGSGMIDWKKVEVDFNMATQSVTINPIQDVDGRDVYTQSTRLQFRQIVEFIEQPILPEVAE